MDKSKKPSKTGFTIRLSHIMESFLDYGVSIDPESVRSDLIVRALKQYITSLPRWDLDDFKSRYTEVISELSEEEKSLLQDQFELFEISLKNVHEVHALKKNGLSTHRGLFKGEKS